MGEIVYVDRHVEVADEDYQNHRSYWVYKVKLAVLTDRWEEAMRYAMKAVEYPSESENEWKYVTRAIEGRLKQVRERINQTQSFLFGDRSMGTKEMFAVKAQHHKDAQVSKLYEACSVAGNILDRLENHSEAAEVAITRLRGDIARYTGNAQEAESHYHKMSGKSGCYHSSCAKLGLHVMGKGESAAPAMTGTVADLPLIPVKLSTVYAHQRDTKVHLPFSDEELQPAMVPQ